MIAQQTPLHAAASSSSLADSSCKEDVSFDDIPYDPELVVAVEEALTSMKRGESIPFEEFDKEIDSWFSE